MFCDQFLRGGLSNSRCVLNTVRVILHQASPSPRYTGYGFGKALFERCDWGKGAHRRLLRACESEAQKQRPVAQKQRSPWGEQEQCRHSAVLRGY